jgi:hypothetical protein
LAVIGEYLSASLGQLGTILLETGQNSEIALVHQLAAVARNVPRASLLFLVSPTVLPLTLSHRCSRAEHQQSEQ